MLRLRVKTRWATGLPDTDPRTWHG